LASRGFGRENFEEVGAILADALAVLDPVPPASLAHRVAVLTTKTPLYGYLA
jgi:glycine/serine hydroxymethyltransferase